MSSRNHAGGAPGRSSRSVERPQHSDTRPSTAVLLRRDMVQLEVPTALFIVAGLLLVVSMVELAVAGAMDGDAYLGALAASLLLALLGVAIRWSRRLRQASPWLFAVAMVMVVGWLLTAFWQNPDLAHTGYIAVILVALGPIVLEWAPFLFGAAGMMAATVGTAWANSWGQPTAWVSTCLLATFAGSALLYLRRRSLAAVAEARDLAEQRAITDSLTGVLNRTGLDAMLPGLTATALRLGQPIVVTFIDIDGLKAANDTYGHDFGDEVITCVANAIRAAGRQGDIVARWGGDEFLVVGMGIESDPDAITARIDRHIRASDIDMSRWHGAISVGSAYGMPSAVSVEDLIARADERMYSARRRRRIDVD
jgi:diguanylate cyclase (GGDEF)-like protein